MADNFEQLESDIRELKCLLEKKNGNGSLTSHLKGVQALVYLIVILVGVGINWGMTTSKISTMQTSVTAMEQKLSKTESELRDLQLKQAGDDRTLATLQSDITEIKQDLKKLIARRNGGNE